MAKLTENAKENIRAINTAATDAKVAVRVADKATQDKATAAEAQGKIDAGLALVRGFAETSANLELTSIFDRVVMTTASVADGKGDASVAHKAAGMVIAAKYAEMNAGFGGSTSPATIAIHKNVYALIRKESPMSIAKILPENLRPYGVNEGDDTRTVEEIISDLNNFFGANADGKLSADGRKAANKLFRDASATLRDATAKAAEKRKAEKDAANDTPDARRAVAVKAASDTVTAIDAVKTDGVAWTSDTLDEAISDLVKARTALDDRITELENLRAEQFAVVTTSEEIDIDASELLDEPELLEV